MSKLIPIFLILFLIGTANALNITLSDITLGKQIKVLVYDSQGHLIGEYNSTDTITNLSADKDYIFVFKPAPQDWFNNPLNALELFKASIPPALSYVLFLAVILATVYLIKKAILG